MPARGGKGKGGYDGSNSWKGTDGGYDSTHGGWNDSSHGGWKDDGSYGGWKTDYYDRSYGSWKDDYRSEDWTNSGRKGGGRGKGHSEEGDAAYFSASRSEVETSEGKRQKGKGRKAGSSTREDGDAGDEWQWNAKEKYERGEGRRGKGYGDRESEEDYKEGSVDKSNSNRPLNSNAPNFTPQSYSCGAGFEDGTQYWEWQQQQQQQQQQEQQQTSMPLWTEYSDEEGVSYYYNSKTGLCQWERPPELDPPKQPLKDIGGSEKSKENVSGNRREVGSKDVEKDGSRRGASSGGSGNPQRGDGEGGGKHRAGSSGAGAGGGGKGGGGGSGSGGCAGGEGGEGGGGRGNRGRRKAKAEDPAAKKEASEFGPPGCNLFVFHLPDDWADDDLNEYFAPHGNVVSAKVMKELGTGRSRGFGFVSYEDRVSAATAIKKMQGYKVLGKRLKVEFKKGEHEGGRGEGDDKGCDFPDGDEGPSKKTYPDDERLIGYLRAISAKNVVQSLKESEGARGDGVASEGGDEPDAL